MSVMAPTRRRFSKMHGAGNDFVVLDLRDGASPPTPAEAARMADRHRGIGFDQLLTVEPPATPGAVADYRIWNADGSAAGQCGNGARCVAAWLKRDGAARGPRFAMGSPAGRIEADALEDGSFRLAMSVPVFAPARIPLVVAVEAPRYVAEGPFGVLAFGAVSMGNPHALIEVAPQGSAPAGAALAAVDAAGIGGWLQGSALFPDSVNVGFVEVLAPDHVALRVFERGVGETLACGSGACAAVAILVRQGRVDRAVRVDLPGGTLHIDWPSDDAPVSMRGPAAFVFEGEWWDEGAGIDG
ncbi:MAG: diaminopimelate epimerase [Silanimonas sp.]